MDSIAKLFGGPTTTRIARWFLFHPDTSATASMLRDKTKSSPDQVRKSLRLLYSADLIKKRGDRYTLNDEFPNLPPLKEFLIGELLQTTNILPRLRPVGVLKMVCAAGVFIGNVDSRTDILIVGDKMKTGMLQKSIAQLEADVGTEIRYTALSGEEFKYRMAFRDKLVRDILDYPHVTLFDKLTPAE